MERDRTRTRIPAATVLERAGPLLVLALVAAGLRLEPRAFATPPPGVGKPTVAFLRQMSAAAPFRLMAANLDFPAPYGLSGTIVSAGTVFEHAPSPDGKWIASRADANAPGVFELFVVRLEAGDAVCASGSTPAGTGVNIVAWARNSKRLAFLGQMDHTFRELYTTRIDKPARIRVSKPPASGGRVNGFQGSPNGSRIAYAGDMDTENRNELYLTAPDADKTVKVSSPMQPMGDVNQFGWLPSNAGLVYRADDVVDGDSSFSR